MDVTRMLEADHRQVEQLFEDIAKAEGADRLPLIHQLETALTAHMELEEKVVYPAMEPVTGRQAVQEGVTEHELARKTLAEMVGLAPDQPGFEGAMEAVKAGIEHHVEDEEGKVFPELRAEERLLADLATPFMGTRMELGLPMDAEALAAACSKDELWHEAETAGLEPARSATKDDLARALADHMAGLATG